VGFEMEFKHLDSHIVKIKREEITWPGATIKKKGEGMPNLENNLSKGDMFITFDISFPKKDLSNEEKECKKKIIKKEVNFLIINLKF
jgi:DnaJ family protein B protein 11